MAETRAIKQFKIYTLFANVETPRGKDKGKVITRTDRVALAIFDDAKVLKKFQDNNKAKLANQIGYEVVEDWVEVEPVASGFSLPFNPAPNASESVAKAQEVSQDNGTH